MWVGLLWMALLVGSLRRPWLRGGPLLGLGLWPGLRSWALREPLGWLGPLHLLHLRLRLDWSGVSFRRRSGLAFRDWPVLRWRRSNLRLRLWRWSYFLLGFG